MMVVLNVDPQGLCHSSAGYLLYMSDGTSKIYHVDGKTMKTIRSVTVKYKNGNIQAKINELEYVDGFIYANIWYEQILIKIDPDTGVIEKTWDIQTLASTERDY